MAALVNNWANHILGQSIHLSATDLLNSGTGQQWAVDVAAKDDGGLASVMNVLVQWVRCAVVCALVASSENQSSLVILPGARWISRMTTTSFQSATLDWAGTAPSHAA